MKEGMKQTAAAAAAGMSERAARKWQAGPLPSQAKKQRDWRTRADPFEGVWDEFVVPLLEADTDGVLEAKTLMELLVDRDPQAYSMGQVRTMQRRVRDWRAKRGPAKEAYFPQQHRPGHEAGLDFTCCVLQRARSDDPRRAVQAPTVRARDDLQRLDVGLCRAIGDVRSATGWPPASPVGARRRARAAVARQHVGRDTRAQARWRSGVDVSSEASTTGD